MKCIRLLLNLRNNHFEMVNRIEHFREQILARHQIDEDTQDLPYDMKKQDKEINSFILHNLHPRLSDYLEHIRLNNHADSVMNERYGFDKPRQDFRDLRYERPRQVPHNEYRQQWERTRYHESPRNETRQHHYYSAHNRPYYEKRK